MPLNKETKPDQTKHIDNWKAEALDEISPEVWKSRKMDNSFLRLCNAVYKQNITVK